jgi:hypothetical protein
MLAQGFEVALTPNDIRSLGFADDVAVIRKCWQSRRIGEA